MGADYIVHWPCAPKLAFGDGDALEGTKAMMSMIKARNSARVLLEHKKGEDPSTLTVKMVRMTPDGVTEKEVSYAELAAEAAPLDAHAKSCEGCPANFLRQPYGCYGAVPYPVSAAGEEWLVSRLQPADSAGGFLLLSAIRDFGYDGAPVARMRAAGMFEVRRTAEKVVLKRFFGSTRVSGDQLFQAIFFVGGALLAGHCSMVLNFIGALSVNGRIPTTKEDGALLLMMTNATTPEERLALTKLELGPERDELRAIHDLLRGLYAAYVLDVDLLMEA